jgi:hypothetical protein
MSDDACIKGRGHVHRVSCVRREGEKTGREILSFSLGTYKNKVERERERGMERQMIG